MRHAQRSLIRRVGPASCPTSQADQTAPQTARPLVGQVQRTVNVPMVLWVQ